MSTPIAIKLKAEMQLILIMLAGELELFFWKNENIVVQIYIVPTTLKLKNISKTYINLFFSKEIYISNFLSFFSQFTLATDNKLLYGSLK